MLNGLTPPKQKFHDVFVTVSRAHHNSLSTEKSYWHCAKRYIKWLGVKSASELADNATENFRKYLSEMANHGERINGDEGVSASTQNQNFHAIRFLLEKVIGVQLGDLSGIPRATRHGRIVQVPTHDVAFRLVSSITGNCGTALRLIYGTGGRLLVDILRLRIKDLDFDRREISFQQSKGGKARVVPMPESMVGELALLVEERKRTHEGDIAAGLGWVHLPGNLAKKYQSFEQSEDWQYLFASHKISKDPVTGNLGRHHLQPETLQKAFNEAKRKCRIKRGYTIHSLRHAYAQFMEKKGVPTSDIAQLLGHSDIETTHRYLKSGRHGPRKGLPTPI